MVNNYLLHCVVFHVESWRAFILVTLLIAIASHLAAGLVLIPQHGQAIQRGIQIAARMSKKVSEESEYQSRPGVGEDDLEKRRSNSPAPLKHDHSVGPDDEIQWHYLTFDTELPAPADSARSSVSSTSEQRVLAPPDLKKYTNPFQWPRSRKYTMSWLGCIATTITAYTAGSYAAGIDQMMEEWQISKPVAELGITMFTCGFAIAPMFLAPFSEINGRRPVFVTAGCLFTILQLTCALTPTFGGMLVARFLIGCASSTFSTMVGGVISDFYAAKDRNWAMAIFTCGSMGGTGLGPLVSGFIAQNTTWRWIFRLQAINCAMLMVVLFFFFSESRGSILLSRKAKALNKWYEQREAAGCYGFIMPDGYDTSANSSGKRQSRQVQRVRWKVKSDEERASIPKMISISLYRPFHLLLTEPVVFFFSLWITFAWSCLYLMFGAVPLIFSTIYDFNVAQCGAVFAAITIGSLLSCVISVYQEGLARRYLPKKWQPFFATPEGRLFFCCVQSALLPIGQFWYGWTSFSNIHWILPTLGLGCATMGIFSIYLAVFNYLADIYHIYASSALAAQSFCRNMAAGAFPVFVDAMFRRLTYQGAGSFLGAVSALLTVVPWLLVFFGPRIRARSKIARELLAEADRK